MHYRISGSSMEPNLASGSLVFAIRPRGLKVGDVVLLKDPREPRRVIVKRVSKIEGERLILLGDNPTESTDSRVFGSVDREKIIGKVVFKYPKTTKEWLRLSLVVFALGGLLDATYLTIKHFEGGEVACGIVPGADCDLVLGSMYSEIFGIPLALVGVLYYLSVLLLAGAYLKFGRHTFLQMLLPLTIAGFLASLYLVYLQIFVIGALCGYCLISAFTSTVLVGVVATLALKEHKGRKIEV